MQAYSLIYIIELCLTSQGEHFTYAYLHALHFRFNQKFGARTQSIKNTVKQFNFVSKYNFTIIRQLSDKTIIRQENIQEIE